MDVSTAKTQKIPFADRGSPYIKIGSLKPNQILHLPTGTIVRFKEMMADISASRVIYVGETHDNLESHRVQLEVLKKLAERFPGKLAVGMEMFRRSSQEELDRWIKGELNQHDFLVLWQKNWGNDYKSYRPILEFIRKNKIPLIGLKPSAEAEKLIHQKGFKGLSEAEKKILPEVDEHDPFHKAYATAIFGGHNDKEKHSLKHPYQMLLFWEETMAESVVNFLKSARGKERKMLVFSGGFHVEYGFGIPKRAYRRMPHNYSTIIPLVNSVPEELADRIMTNVNPPSVPLLLGDYIWNVEYKVSPQRPKVRLGVTLRGEEKGLKVLAVKKDSNAFRAGIKKGDYLIALDDFSLDSLEGLIVLLKTKKIGERVKIGLARQGEKIVVEVEFRK